MNNTGRRIAKNASVLMVAQLITWALSLVLSIFMTRSLGPAGIGKYQLAISIWAIMSILITFGMDMFLVKEIARNPENLPEFYSTSTITRIILYAVGFAITGLYVSLANYPADTVTIIYIIGISSLLGVIGGACQASLQGLERMEFVSIGDIVSKGFITVAIIALLLAGFGLKQVAIVIIVGAAISFIIQFLALRRLQPLRLVFHFPKAKWMLAASFPYLMIIGVRTIYSQIDVVVISLLVNETVLGWYSMATRLFATFLFIPTVIMMAVFPVMSRIHTADPESLPKLFRKNVDFVLLLGVPIGLGLMVISDQLVVLLFGEAFAKSGVVLAIMGLVLIMTYQNMAIGQFLISTDRQNVWTKVMAIAIGVTILLDIVLIPFCQSQFDNGAIGGALSFLVTETAMTIYGIWLLRKELRSAPNGWSSIRIVAAGLLMVAGTWWLRDMFILVPIIVGAVIYSGAIVVLKVIPKEDRDMFGSMLQSLVARIRKLKPETSGVRG